MTKNADIVNLLNTIPGLYWKCSDCNKNYVLIDSAGVQGVVERKLSEALSSLQGQISTIKSDITKLAEYDSSAVRQPKYSDVLKDKSQPVVIVRPKDCNQSPHHTKADILRNVNPCQENFQLAKVRDVKDGGVLIACRDKADNEKLKSMIEQKMSDNYSVNEVGGILSKIRIVGMTENFSSEDLRNYLFACNTNVFFRIHSVKC